MTYQSPSTYNIFKFPSFLITSNAPMAITNQALFAGKGLPLSKKYKDTDYRLWSVNLDYGDCACVAYLCRGSHINLLD